MKRFFSFLATMMVTFLLSTSAIAWSSTTPPGTSNAGSLDTTGVTVGFGTNGISTSIDTVKCYKGLSTYKVKASGLYLAGNSEKLCTVKLGVDYWNADKSDWDAGNRYVKKLPKTNVKDSTGIYQPSKQSISSQSVLAQSSSKYHYGIFTKDYTSVKMYGGFTLHK